MIGSATRKASHGQSDHMLQDPQVLFQAGEREKEFLRSQMQSEMQSQLVSFRRVPQEREVEQEHISTIWGHSEAR